MSDFDWYRHPSVVLVPRDGLSICITSDGMVTLMQQGRWDAPDDVYITFPAEDGRRVAERITELVDAASSADGSVGQ